MGRTLGVKLIAMLRPRDKRLALLYHLFFLVQWFLGRFLNTSPYFHHFLIISSRRKNIGLSLNNFWFLQWVNIRRLKKKTPHDRSSFKTRQTNSIVSTRENDKITKLAWTSQTPLLTLLLFKFIPRGVYF